MRTYTRALLTGLAATAAFAAVVMPANASSRYCELPTCTSDLNSSGFFNFSSSRFFGHADVTIGAQVLHATTPGAPAAIEDFSYFLDKPAIGSYGAGNRRHLDYSITASVEFQDAAQVRATGNGWGGTPAPAEVAAMTAGRQETNTRKNTGNTVSISWNWTAPDEINDPNDPTNPNNPNNPNGNPNTGMVECKDGSYKKGPDNIQNVGLPSAAAQSKPFMNFVLRGDMNLRFHDGSTFNWHTEDRISG